MVQVHSIEGKRHIYLGVTGELQTLVSLVELVKFRKGILHLDGRLGPLEYNGIQVDPDQVIHEINDVSGYGVHVTP